jgi:hypothetical protein
MTGEKLVLAVATSPRGFAFVLFRYGATPLDWGIKTIPGAQKNPRCVLAIKKLIRQYRPSVIVLEEMGKDSRRGPRLRALNREIAELATRERVKVVRLTTAKVRATFAPENARTKAAIAQAIAARIPAFAPKLPPPRRIWMSEDPRQSLLDAVALRLTFPEESRVAQTLIEKHRHCTRRSTGAPLFFMEQKVG